MNYHEALAWLYATQKFGIKLGLENTQQLLRSLHIDKLGRIIHVAGTNGKGSVCAFAQSICRAAGYRTGLFTSPHLISFRERIRVGGEMISKQEVAAGLSAIRHLIENWEPHPTFFEITTALALRHFAQTRCEIIVLETGMGGRLDATNALTPDVSVVTRIDLDHQKWLGSSIAEIATEKAGIIKHNIPVVSAMQQKQAAEVIRQRAQECSSRLEVVARPWASSKIGLRGGHQRENAALAVAAVQQLELSISEDAIRCGLKTVEWPARFQIWNERIVIDGAHNPAGARSLVQTWREEFGNERAIIIVAILRDKSFIDIIDLLAPIASQFLLPAIKSERAVPPGELASHLSSATPPFQYGLTTSVTEALSLTERKSDRILITGSLHFAGEALAYLRGDLDALEECAQ